jgi:hydroxymethylglutaryl-CoA lyase
MGTSLPRSVTLNEVGPREGFQFEGIGQPEKIALADKVRLIEMLAETGVGNIEMCSFVSPKQVPQMADAEALCRAVQPRPGMTYSCIYLNDRGLERALAAGLVKITGKITLTASETFALRNQKRTLAEDFEMQRKMAAVYRQHGIAVTSGMLMAAFGCNYEGEVPLTRVLERAEGLHRIAAEAGSSLRSLSLADTMGWADPEQIRRTVGAVRNRWPEVSVSLHLHDTRGLGVANVYAAMLEGVDRFDCAVAGLGGCPFAGHKGAAGNVCSEEIVFLCRQMGIETGIDLERLVECARFATGIVGHPLPSNLLYPSLRLQAKEAVAA